MRTIGFIIAMEKEKQALMNLFENIENVNIHGINFTKASYQDKNIVLALAGIGKVNAAHTTTLLIEHFNVDLIISSGIAGGFDKNLKTLDFVVATSVSYADVDAALEGGEVYGQIPGMPKEYKCQYETIEKANIENVYYGKVLSGDQFVTNYDKVSKIVDSYFPNQSVMAFEMELGAVAQIAYLMNVPLIGIKCISDIIGETNLTDYNTFSFEASAKLATLVEKVLNIL